MENKKYFVFISYSSKDNEGDNKWAEWLRHELDHWHLPTTYHGRKPVQENLREVFRDRDGFCAGKEWDKQVEQILKESQNLIVICSPNAAKSEAVNKEVEFFVNQKKEDSIFPFIVEGDCPAECFPRALKHSIVGGDVNKDGGRDAAFIKVVAGMLGVDFSDLYNRYELDKAEQERIEREKKEKLQIAQSRFAAEKANKIVEEDPLLAIRLALELLPTNLYAPERPYVVEAELLLRKSLSRNVSIYKSKYLIRYAKFSPDKKFIIASLKDFTYCIWDVNTGELVHQCKEPSLANHFSCNSDLTQIATCDFYNQIHIWDLEKDVIIRNIEVNDVGNKYVEFINDEILLIVTEENEIYTWNIKCNNLLRRLGHFSDELNNNVPICAQHGLFCKINKSNQIVIENILSGEIISKLADCESESNPQLYFSLITFSPDGQLLGAKFNGKFYFWDVYKGKLLRVVEGIDSDVGTMALQSNPHLVALGFQSVGIEIWDLLKWEKIASFTESISRDTILQFGLNGDSILVCNCFFDVKIFKIHKDVETEKIILLDNDVAKSCYSTQNRHLATIDISGNIRVWSVKTFHLEYGFPTGLNDVISVSITSDGLHVITLSSKSLAANVKFLLQQKAQEEDVGMIMTIWNTDGDICSIIDFKDDCPIQADITPDNRSLIIESLGSMQIWRNKKNKLFKEWETEDFDFNLFACDSAGTIFAASSSKDSFIRIYNKNNHSLLTTCRSDSDEFTCLAISADGRYLASGAETGVIRIWDLSIGQQLKSWKAHNFQIISIAFGSTENKLFTLSIESFQVWDSLSGTLIHTFDNAIDTSGWSNTIKVINEKQVLLICGKSIKLYNFSPLQEIINSNLFHTKRKLTDDEKKKYYLE